MAAESCKECTFATGRHPGCQATCQVYKGFREQLDKKNLMRERALGIERYKLGVTAEARNLYAISRKHARERIRR